MFEQAVRSKLRFDTKKGQLSVEELYDLSLSDLDRLAIGVNKQLADENTESFIPNKRKAATHNGLRLDILKHIIGVKVTEEDVAKKRAEARSRLAYLKELATSKANEKLSSQSLEDIQKMIALEEASLT